MGTYEAGQSYPRKGVRPNSLPDREPNQNLGCTGLPLGYSKVDSLYVGGSFMDKVRILVTGGSGFVGQVLLPRLETRDYEIINLDLVIGKFKSKSLVNELYCDIREFNEVDNAFKEFKPHKVVHLAALTDVRESIQNPMQDLETNAVGTLNVVKSCNKYKVSKVVYLNSGGAIYGDQTDFPISEISPVKPISPYGASKFFGENIISTIGEMDWTSLRLSNVYGGLDSKGVINIFLRNFIHERPCYVFGDGSTTRDYIHVRDVVDAILKSMESDLLGIFNVSSSIETSLKDVYQVIKKISGKEVPIEFTPAIAGEISRSALSNCKLQEFGWSPKVSLSAGIEKLYYELLNTEASEVF